MEVVKTVFKINLYFIVLILTFASLLSLFLSYLSFKRVRSYKNWKTTKGIILKSSTIKLVKWEKVNGYRRKVTKYSPEITYAYTFKGEKYQSNNIILGRKIFNFKSDAEEYLEKIPSKPKVYFNPKIPKESYLELNTSYSGTIVTLLLGVFFMLLSIFLYSTRENEVVSGLLFFR